MKSLGKKYRQQLTSVFSSKAKVSNLEDKIPAFH
jgi:hypothetical protein